MTKHIGRLLSFAVAIAAVTLAVAAPADARLINPTEVTCWPGRMIVSSPGMEPLGGGWFVGSDGTITIDPPQWVAFRPHLTKLVGSRWVIVASGTWKAREVTMAGGLGDTWLNLDTNQWESGTTLFYPRSSGSYRIWVDYHWYANAFYRSGSHSAFTWLHYDYRSGYMSEAYQYCNY